MAAVPTPSGCVFLPYYRIASSTFNQANMNRHWHRLTSNFIMQILRWSNSVGKAHWAPRGTCFRCRRMYLYGRAISTQHERMRAKNTRALCCCLSVWVNVWRGGIWKSASLRYFLFYIFCAALNTVFVNGNVPLETCLSRSKKCTYVHW